MEMKKSTFLLSKRNFNMYKRVERRVIIFSETNTNRNFIIDLVKCGKFDGLQSIEIWGKPFKQEKGLAVLLVLICKIVDLKNTFILATKKLITQRLMAKHFNTVL